ncbi:hypothetical protein BKA70DRAFT_1088991 [Coprinopsis sp. MPI-PUGE-AT-0042]|nr:hypothetical protein BKA70DRAFT_1088991 [Coprinopsis sp. MPI-PUGE-AT-0042]
MVAPTFILFYLFSLLGSAFAANDWSKPCLSGVCFYDLPTSDVGASGTLKIWGSPDAITDITTAAGWEIIDCKPDVTTQDIRLVCTGDEKCEHLYKNIGAEGKIVRLPENCGSNAFAHISRAWVPENQSIPENISKRLVRRDGVEPEVKALRLDTNFAAADPAKVGDVNFALTGANVPGAKDQIEFPEGPNEIARRGFFKKLFKGAKKLVKGVVNGAKKAVKKVVDGSSAVHAYHCSNLVIKDLNTVEIDKTKTLKPVEFSKVFTLVDETLNCPPIQGRLKVDVDAKGNAAASINVAAEGTIIPPKVKDFAVTANLDGAIDGVIDIAAGLTGRLDSGTIKLIEVGIPGLSFPGILTIGPSFRVDARATAALDMTADLKVGISYKLDNAVLVFPSDSKKAQQQGSSFKIGDTPLKLAVVPSVKATGTVEAHLIPSLNLGISALAGLADARVFLELDASAAMKLEVEGRAAAVASVNLAQSSAAALPATPQPSQGLPQQARSLQIRGSRPIGHDYFARQLATQTDVQGTFGGCFEISVGLAVNAGADADFFGLFDFDKKFSLFKEDFELFKKCFGDRANERRSLSGRYARRVSEMSVRSPLPVLHTLQRRLECSVSAGQATPEAIVDEVVPAST